MINATLLIYSYPRDARYDVFESGYRGEIIEDYGFEITQRLPAIGDTRTDHYHSWENGKLSDGVRRWQIAQVSEYDGGGDCKLAVAQLTFDGNPAEIARGNSYYNIVQVAVTPDDFKIWWPAQGDYAQKVGDLSSADCPYEIVKIDTFKSTNSKDVYDEVQLCWCHPISVAAPELVETR